MDPDVLRLLSIFGLATATGISASLPLLLVGLAARGGWIALAPPYDVVASTPVLALLGLLVVGSIVADHFPTYRKDLAEVELLLALAAGAVVSGVQAGAIDDVDPRLVIALGLTTTGAMHLSRTTIGRPLAAVPGARGTARLAAVSLSGAAIAAPWAVPLLLGFFVVVLVLSLVVATKLLRPLLRPLAALILSLVDRLVDLVTGSGPRADRSAVAGSTPPHTDPHGAPTRRHASRRVAPPHADASSTRRRDDRTVIPDGSPDAPVWPYADDPWPWDDDAPDAAVDDAAAG